jgi:hypothetical protein
MRRDSPAGPKRLAPQPAERAREPLPPGARPTQIEPAATPTAAEAAGNLALGRALAAHGSEPQGLDEVVSALRADGGHALPSDVRAELEPRFGFELGGVRVHTGEAVGRAALSIGARAFTHGTDIGFAPAEYQPATARGRTLLAHEIAHVAQRGRAPRTVFRALHDFEIRGKFGAAAAFSNFVFFNESSTAPDAVERAKIAAFAAPSGDMLTLNGFSSEEGSGAGNVATVNARLNAVAAELAAKGHDPAKITKNPLPTSGEGRIDYRRMRSVEILRPGSASAVPSAAAASTAACAGTNETDFKDAEAEGESMIAKGVTALAAPVDPAMKTILDRLFGGWGAADAATIQSNLSKIKSQLGLLTPSANHQCANIKFAPCEAGSAAQNVGSGGAAMMTLCPSFFTGGSKKSRGGTLIHEAAHGTPGLVTDDKAYAHERLIEFLSLADALKNSDSYVLLVRLFDTAGSMKVGPATPDTITGMLPGEERAARRTIAWMEKWLIWSYQEMSSLYDTIHASIAAGSWTNSYYEDTMSLAAPIFGLTPPPATPTHLDKIKVAAIHDRFHTMRSVEWSKAVTLNKVAAATDSWTPGPGSSVDLGTAFFAASARAQLDRMLTAIAKATPDISPGFVSKYVALADKIRTHMGGGAP